MVSRASRASSMEDSPDSSDDSSSPTHLSVHSNKLSNTYNASTRYLNLTDPNNPFRLDNGDNPAVILVTDFLTNDNYITWSRAMRRALRAKNKLGFISGSLSQPTDPNDPLLDLWNRCNDMVVSWLQNSICPSIRSSIAFVDDAREIWLDLEDRFAHQNGPRIYQLKKNLASLLQESDTVSVYYGKLKTIWDELLICDPIPLCTCGSMKTLSDRYQRDCIFQFLMGLHDSYSPVRDQIMLLDPLPPLTKVFSIIQQQERHYQMASTNPSPDSLAFAVRKPYSNPTKAFPQSKSKKDRAYCTYCKITGHTFDTCFKAGNAEPPVCSHCNMSGHTMEKCYKLHGYPPGHKFFNNTQSSSALAAQSASEPETISDVQVGLTKTQYQQLLALLQPREPSIAVQPSANQIQSNFPSTSTTHISGATDHMVCCPSLLTSITASISQSVRLPNGITVPVTHTGTVQLSSLISLNNDLLSWTTIGKGEVRNGLYYLLNTAVSPSTLASTLLKFNKTPPTACVLHSHTVTDL
ncbi:hypothetical protein F2P56_033784 [Juglans regia]|uniref:Retrotransposon Copia-like N-terminal domain-containing protein n=1 Tax=Juglans regia TaxID=51240 RepID=A0A833WTH6_JUGRE|nr:hypothetical protein F2P56_033784 [Juglans regia]